MAAWPSSCLAAAGGTVAALPLAVGGRRRRRRWAGRVGARVADAGRAGRAPCSAGACRKWAAVLGCSLGGLAVAAG